MKILDIGCGELKTEESIGMDIRKEVADVVHDMNTVPYPFDDEEFEMVVMKHSLEHCKSRKKVLNEVNRVLKLGGVLKITVPHFSGFTAYNSIEHNHFFDINSLREIERFGFTVHDVNLNYFINPFNHWWMTIINKIMNPIINMRFWLTERLFCYWIGGIEEIEMILIKSR